MMYVPNHQWQAYSKRDSFTECTEFSAVDILCFIAVTVPYPGQYEPIPYQPSHSYLFNNAITTMTKLDKRELHRTIAVNPIALERWLLGTLYEDIIAAAVKKADRTKGKKDTFQIVMEAVMEVVGSKNVLEASDVLKTIQNQISAVAILKRQDMLRTQFSYSMNTLYAVLKAIKG